MNTDRSESMMRKRLILINICTITYFFVAFASFAAELPPARAVVVCPDEFRKALAPWIEHRRAQGYEIDVIANTGTPQQIRDQIRKRLDNSQRRFILLVGDARMPEALMTGRQAMVARFSKQNHPADRDDPRRCVPTYYSQAKVNVLWGGAPNIATDNWYADLDDDGAPDAAVGRLTPDTPEELAVIVKKIIDFERSADFGPWRRRLNFVAGIGGFGLLADTAIESVARHFLTHGIPAGYQVSMTQASWRSPYCPDPRRFHQTIVERLNEGSTIWVYIGHGSEEHVDRVHVPGADYKLLAAGDVAELKCSAGAPIAIFLACHAGSFDLCDCLAEEMLRTPGAPVAVIAGSRVTMPYGMSVLATGIMDECFQRRAATLGEAFLAAKRKMLEPDASNDNRKKLDALAAAVSPAINKLDDERADHLSLFNIIGDPMLRMRYPGPVALDVPATADAGGEVKISGASPVAGRATVELVVRRDRFAQRLPRRASYPNDLDDLSSFQMVYKKANDRRLHTVEITVPAGRFKTALKIPKTASGPCHVRVFVQGEADFALGSANITIRN